MATAAVDGSPVKRDQALAYIVERIARTGTSPTYAEIGRAIDVSDTRAKQLVAQLVKRGVIEKIDGMHRNLRVRDIAQTRVTFDQALLRLGWTVAEPMGVLQGGFPKGQLAVLPPFQHLPDVD